MKEAIRCEVRALAARKNGPAHAVHSNARVALLGVCMTRRVALRYEKGVWLFAAACLALDMTAMNADLAKAQEVEGDVAKATADAVDILGAGAELGQVRSLKDPVSLEYRNAPLVDVLRSLADSARINLALSTQVSAQRDLVTIRLANVSYEIALKTILDLYKLGAVVENGILRIDTLANLSRERQDKIQAKKEIWQTEPTRTLIFQVNYGMSLKYSSGLSSCILNFLPMLLVSFAGGSQLLRAARIL